MKYCIQCKHVATLGSQYLCTRPTGVSLVTGEQENNRNYAELERTLNHTGCGLEAVYFEPKEVSK